MNIGFHDVDSVAVFGSVARGDSDRLSDKDILLVGGSAIGRVRASEYVRANGWSPTAFSWTRFGRLAAQNSLFVQHLKQEGRVVRDKDGRLRDVLCAFQPRTSYYREEVGAKGLLNALDSIPAGQQGLYWASDVLAVGFRSLSVAYLANAGIYEFSFERILGGLSKVGVINSGDIASLRKLRELKRRFRGQQISRPISERAVLSIARIVDRRFHLGINIKTVRPEVSLAVGCAAVGMGGAEWYQASRRLEAGLLNLRAEDYEEAVRRDLLRLIRRPGDYGWHFKLPCQDLCQGIRILERGKGVRFVSVPTNSLLRQQDQERSAVVHNGHAHRPGSTNTASPQSISFPARISNR
jgi:hypothetical protein